MYKRILLKLSGEALSGDKGFGLDEATTRKVAQQVKEAAKAGAQIAIVIGGGNFWRGRSADGIDRVKADQIGMLGTVMNCLYVSEIFRTEGMETAVYTPYAIEESLFLAAARAIPSFLQIWERRCARRKQTVKSF